ncbi:autotransporter domain-containing protein [Nitratireductor kimnyeongensis]|uniref:Autotransporter domain-containing protein n=1 Tax=Nitratireductor kimnyeongensis TaxID=430679 RepID=A0ABW0T7F1_9HYPH|nr:autotransporter domain-containing protein [Nitratireductor kimnyeongensis]QZZ34039.1 autotransporter domain-containing protein [Nitratireductor kimnyeongensis]
MPKTVGRVSINTLSRALLCSTAIAGCLLGASVPAMAQSINWDGDTSSDWGTADNWDLGVVPTGVLNVYLNGDGADPVIDGVVMGGTAHAGTIIFGSTPASPGSLLFDNGGRLESGTAYVGDAASSQHSIRLQGASSWEVTGTIFLGSVSQGNLAVTAASTMTSSDAVLGMGAFTYGIATVQNAGSSWDAGEDLTVGRNGTGQLFILDQGVVGAEYVALAEEAGSTGVVLVNGAGSQLIVDHSLDVGEGGEGQLAITDGGYVSSSDIARIGRDTGSQGAVQVATNGVWDHAGTIVVGGEGEGYLTIDVDGAVNSVNGIIGQTSGSVGSALVGGTWTNTGYITVGQSSLGEMRIANGQVTSSFGIIADNAGADGSSVTVDGASASWNANDGLYVGDGGDGRLDIINGGLVTADEVEIGGGGGTQGAVLVDGAGSLLDAVNVLSVGVDTVGSLQVVNRARATTYRARIGSDADGVGTVTVDGSGSSFDVDENLYVGWSGNGRIDVVNEGQVEADILIIAENPGSAGDILVDGAGTVLSANELLVGWEGDGALTISNGGRVNSTHGYVAQLDTSSGSVTVTGPGSSWWLTGASGNLFVGEEAEGTLVVANGGLVNQDAGDAHIGAGTNLAGLGNVLVTGPGSEWVTSGRIYVGSSNSGTVTIADGGSVESAELLIASASGFAGTLNIGAVSGGTAAGAGTLSTSAVAFGDGDGTLVFNHTDSGYDFNTFLASSGTGTHQVLQEAGVTLFSGDWSAFNGTTTVSGGTLMVNGLLNGAIQVGGGVLGGTGAVGDLALNSGGVLAPGNSIGTINAAGAVINPGGVYEVELNDGGFVAGVNNDLLAVTGAVTINGGTVHVTRENGTDDGSTYTPGTYTIVRAGALTGAFGAVTDDFVFLDFVDSYDYTLNEAYLTSSMAVTSFCVVGMSNNQCAAGEGVFSLGSGNSVFDAVLGLSAAEAPVAFDLLSGEIHASAQTGLLEDSRFPREATTDRLRVALGGLGSDNSAQIEKRISESFGLWGQGYGSWGQWDSDGNAATMDRNIGGFLMGGDALVWDNVRFGVLAGYSRSSFSADDRLSSGSADTYTLGIYSGGGWDAFTLTGGFAHSWHSLNTSRTASFSGFLDSLSASYDARTLQAWGEAAYSFEAGGARFQPFANLAYVNLSTDGFTETGGAAALTASSNVVDATFTTLGLRAETDVSLGDMNATLRGMMGWRHVFGGAPARNMAFASGGDAFTIAGVPMAQNSLVLDAGLDVNLNENAILGFAYGGQFGSGVQDHSANLNLSVRF